MKSDAKPGDTVELKDKEAGFSDPETGFDISRDQKVKLGDRVGERTHQAIATGGLIIVTGRAGKSKSTDGGSDADDVDLPEDLPGREAFIEAGLTFSDVKNLKTDEDLLAVKGIGKKTVDALKEWAEKNPQK